MRGIIVPLATPLTPAGDLDVSSLERLIEHVIAGGVSGIFPLGTTGEGPHLDRHTQAAVIAESCRIVARRCEVIVNVTDASWREAQRKAVFAEHNGATAIVFSPPYYFPLSQEEVLGFGLRLAEACGLPFFVYNIPSHAHTPVNLETMVALSRHPRFLGIKDSTGNWPFFWSILEAFRDNDAATVLMGPEEMLAQAVAAGAHGGVSGGANLWPQLYVRLYAAARDGDGDEAARLHALVMDISANIYGAEGGPNSYLRGLKCALNELGLCGPTLAEPLEPVDDAARRRIRECLDRVGAPRVSAP